MCILSQLKHTTKAVSLEPKAKIAKTWFPPQPTDAPTLMSQQSTSLPPGRWSCPDSRPGAVLGGRPAQCPFPYLEEQFSFVSLRGKGGFKSQNYAL